MCIPCRHLRTKGSQPVPFLIAGLALSEAPFVPLVCNFFCNTLCDKARYKIMFFIVGNLKIIVMVRYGVSTHEGNVKKE